MTPRGRETVLPLVWKTNLPSRQRLIVALHDDLLLARVPSMIVFC